VDGTGRFVGAPSPAAKQAVADASGEGVTLNLVNVPAPQAAKTVLGDILGVKYTVDPTIEGKVTIQTPSPVTRSAAVDLFQSALRSRKDGGAWEARIFIHGKLAAKLIDGAKPGWSALARKNGPLAGVLSQ
jgi:type II secretory pathway component GspD/PulD (secretin)